MSDLTADLVVLGSGVAGCAAAIAGRALGMDVVLLEKAAQLGGMTTQSGGIIWIGASHLNPGGDTPDEAAAYLRCIASGQQDEDKLQAYIDSGREAARWFMEHGLPLQVVKRYSDIFYPTAPGSKLEGRALECEPFPMDELGDWKPLVRESIYQTIQPKGASYLEILSWGGPGNPVGWDREAMERRRRDGDQCGFGYGLAGCLLHLALKAGARVYTRTPAERLVRDGSGRIAGVEAGGQIGGAVRAARAVLIATGDYSNNPFLVRHLEQMPEFWRPSSTSDHTGDGLVMAAEAGALVRRMTPNITIMFGFPANDGGIGVRSGGHVQLARPHSMIVNAQGQRFADESSFQATSAELHRFDVKNHRFINRRCCLIFDAQYVERFGLAGIVPPGEPEPFWLKRGSTLAELADQLGVDARGLEATAERFNDMVRRDVDEDFHRGELHWMRVRLASSGTANPNLGTIERAPFYGFELVAGGGLSGGVLTDDRGRAVSWRGEPLPGLYCLGDVTVHTEYGVGYQAGFNLGGALTFAYRAVHDMTR